MRRALVAVAILALLAGCAPTVQDQSARMRAFGADLDAALAEWQGRVSQRYYPSSVAATRDLVSRYDDVYARWSIAMDPLSQALLAYSMALAERVDRGLVPAAEANGLLAAMKADMDREKQRLSSGPADAAGHDAAMLRWWNGYWTTNRARYQGSAEQPIACQVGPAAGGQRVTCS